MRKSFLVYLLFTSLCFAQNHGESIGNPVKFNFPSGGRLRLQLGAGDVDIVGSKSDEIVVSYKCKRSEDERKVKIEGDIHDNRGTVKVSGPHNNFSYTVQVPEKTDLHVRLSAGDLEVKGVVGNKDIESHAGDLTVEAGDPNQYGEVDASVRVGDLSMPKFDVQKGGIGRSFKKAGAGRYRLHVHLGAGDLTVR